jgi:lantibiotic modifying enzyme
MSSWQPLLPKPLADQALRVVEEIAHDLSKAGAQESSRTGAALASGSSGRALFFAYLEQALPDAGWGDQAAEALGDTIDHLAGMPSTPDLYGGFTGVAWVLEHLQGWFLDEDEDAGGEIATAVEKALRIPWIDFDLLRGLAGVGVWALERSPRPGGDECLRRVVTRLADMADRRGGMVAWATPADQVPPDRRDSFPQGFIFTGVSHGIAGVISLLGEAQAAGVDSRPLLDGAVQWLLAQKLPPEALSVFPSEIADKVAPGFGYPRPTRLAWCHGDPGIAAALLGAARRAGEPSWEREAVMVARAAAARSRAEKSIFDAGLCHGSAGLLHLFNRLYQATGDSALAEAARFWFDRTLELRRPGEGVGGFQAWDIDADRKLGWRDDPGFLTGAAGIGLALLAATTPIEPLWDRALLVSIPPREAGA